MKNGAMVDSILHFTTSLREIDGAGVLRPGRPFFCNHMGTFFSGAEGLFFESCEHGKHGSLNCKKVVGSVGWQDAKHISKSLPSIRLCNHRLNSSLIKVTQSTRCF